MPLTVKELMENQLVKLKKTLERQDKVCNNTREAIKVLETELKQREKESA